MSTLNFNPQGKICVLCGSSRLLRYKAHAYDTDNKSTVSITECNSCNFAWQYPFARNEEQSIEYFESQYKNAGKTNSNYFDPKYKQEIAKMEFDFIAQLPAGGNKILDIGAGAGFFAEVAAENGWAVTAVDPALQIDRISNNQLIRAIRGPLEVAPSENPFNVVTLWDVIEHTTNPIETIASAMHYLQIGGWLVIETGNFKSVDRIFGGLNHWIYQLDHRWYFCPESIERLARGLGFSEFVFSQKVLRPGWQENKNYVGPSISHLLRPIIRHPLQVGRHVKNYVDLQKAKSWKMPRMEIFAVACRKA